MIIERKEYLEKLITWKDKQLIKIVTGVRRCGKSMLLEIYRNYLKERLIDGKMTYIFLDEIQNVTDFPKVLDSLYIKKT